MDIGKFSRKDRRGGPRVWHKRHTLTAAAVLTVAALAAALWYSDLQRRTRDLDAKLKGLEQALAVVGNTLGETEMARERLQGFVDGVQSAIEDRRGALGPALRGLRASIEPGTEIVAIEATPEKSRPGAWSLRVQGSLSGAAPRVLADRARLKLQEMLASGYEVTAPSRFEQFDFASDEGAKPGARKALFTIAATVAPLKKASVHENQAP